MNVEERVEEILSRYQNKFSMLLEEMRGDLMSLGGLQEEGVEEVPLGEIRKIAILKESLQLGQLGRQELSTIAKKYGRNPASVAVFFRPDIHLMEATENDRRFVTPKGEELVQQFQSRFGTGWLDQVIHKIQDGSLPDNIKTKLKRRGQDHE